MHDAPEYILSTITGLFFLDSLTFSGMIFGHPNRYTGSCYDPARILDCVNFVHNSCLQFAWLCYM